MSLRKLGSSELTISSVGLGTWAMAGEGEGGFRWGPQDDAQSIAAIRRAVEKGINWLDTAPTYGLGHSEEIVGRALKEIGNSERPLVFTKCGIVWDAGKQPSHSLKAVSIQREVEESLSRLGLDAIDLYQIHWPAFPPGSPAPDLEEAWMTLAKLKDEGKVRYIGVSNFDVSQLERVGSIAPVTSLQPPYSMLMRQIEAEILPYCRQHSIGVIVYSPLHNGMLSGKMTRSRIASLPDSDWRTQINLAFREPHLTRSLNFVEFLKDIARRKDCSTAELAIAWTLENPAVSGAIVGARSPKQVDGFSGALDLRLSEEEMSEIRTALPESIELFELE